MDQIEALHNLRKEKIKKKVYKKPKDGTHAFYFRITPKHIRLKDGSISHLYYWELRRTIRDPETYKIIENVHVLHLGPTDEAEYMEYQKNGKLDKERLPKNRAFIDKAMNFLKGKHAPLEALMREVSLQMAEAEIKKP